MVVAIETDMGFLEDKWGSSNTLLWSGRFSGKVSSEWGQRTEECVLLFPLLSSTCLDF